MRTDAIVAIQDMGAAGLTSSSFEMAARGGVGIEMDLDRVPTREAGMTPYELMLSESQERMLLVLRQGAEATARAVFAKWDLECVTVGRVTDSGAVVLRWHGDEVAHVPVAPIGREAPLYERAYERRPAPVPIAARDVASPLDRQAALMRLLGCPDLASRRWIFEQYDHMVMGDTVQRPGGDAAVVRIHGSNRGLALTTDCTPRYCAADPRARRHAGGRGGLAQSLRGRRAAARDHRLPELRQPRESARSWASSSAASRAWPQACRALDFPVVSGNVSFYNETDGQAIWPTPTIGGLGLLADLDRMATIAWRSEGLALVLIGETLRLARLLALSARGLRPRGGRAAAGRSADRAAPWRAGARAVRAGPGRGLPRPVRRRPLRRRWPRWRWPRASAPISSCRRTARALPAWLFGEDQGRYLLAVAPDRLAGGRGRGRPGRGAGPTGRHAPAGPR